MQTLFQLPSEVEVPICSEYLPKYLLNLSEGVDSS